MNRNAFIIAVSLIVANPCCGAQQIPALQVTTLDKSQITLPLPGSTKPLLILVAFSRKGGDDTAAWNKHFRANYETDPRIDYIELADLERIPSVVLAMILHGMRRSVQEPERSRLAPLFSQGELWKRLVAEGDPNIAYVVVADPAGHVVWQTKGPASDDKAKALEAAILQLEARVRP